MTKKTEKSRLRNTTRKLAVESLEVRALLAADPIITEFLASNSDGLRDGNGDSSDWIEIYNAGDEPIDLAGAQPWYLTDDSGDLEKWEFPDTPQSTIGPGDYLVVFASGNDVPDPSGNIHTNFQLSAQAGYLALVMPDGQTVASEYGPNGDNYPPQETDVSYGLQGSETVDFATIDYIDADEEPGGNTAGLLGGWVPRGAGAGDGSNNFANEGGALQANGNVSEISTTVSNLDESRIYEVFAFFWDDGSGWNIQAGLESGSLTDFDRSAEGVFAVNEATQTQGSEFVVTGLNVLGQGADTFDDWVDGNRELYGVKLGRISGETSATVYVDHDAALSSRTWFDGVGIRTIDLLVDEDSSADYLIPTNGNLGTTWTEPGFDPASNGFTSGFAAIGYENNPTGNANSFEDHFLTEVREGPSPTGTDSVYLRVPFFIEDESTITDLTLGVKYDDGFAAYLNGTPVLEQFAPDPLTFNSTSLATGRSDSQSQQYAEFSLTQFRGELQNGENVLSFQALNRPGSSDFLMSPRLRAISSILSENSVRYLTNPTPGGLNGNGVLGFVADTKFTADRGFYDSPFQMEITSATPDASIYYTVDGSEPSASNPAAQLLTGPITVSRTTTLRAAAFKEGYEPTDIDTQTYVFLNDVFDQDPINDPQNGLTYPTTWQGGFDGDYTVDDRVVTQWNDNDPSNTDFGIREGLTSIPTISLVMDHEDLWGTGSNGSGGIYPNATSSGSSWRRPGSVEYFDPNTGEEFQFNVGIQMQGAASRDNNRLLKHSFRLVFNSQFDGPGRLNFPLFDNSDFDDINTVSLKASFTDSFATRSVTNRYSPLDSTYSHDVWMRDSQIAMGHLAADSTYTHLYINGLYWGLYWPAERVDDAYLSSRLGGEREDWDIVRDFNELFRGQRTAYDAMFSLSRQIDSASANTADDLYQRILGNLPDGTNDPDRDALLDVDNFVDYMILHLFAGVEDWPSHNWYAARNRVDPGKGFKFYTWDQEISLDQLYRDRTGANNSNTPGELFQNLRNSSEFRLKFADRVQKHLANDGALTPELSQQRWMSRADQIEAAIIGESARWGDAKEGQNVTAYTSRGPFNDGHIPPGNQTIPLMTVDHWRDSIEYVHDSYLENAGGLLLSRLDNDGLLANVTSPEFTINGAPQHGGPVFSGANLGITGSGAIYYTTDGTDPRAAGGGISGTLFSGLIDIETTTVVKARILLGGQWSALTEATFTTDESNLLISEINYNPYAPTTPAELAIPGVSNDDFEFIEVVNTHPTTSLSLLGTQLTGGVTYSFGNVQLAAGERAVIVEDVTAFRARYGNGVRVLGQWSGGLSSSGEELILVDSLGATISSVDYNDNDPWPIAGDGAGASIVLNDAAATTSELSGKYYQWRTSTIFGGSPGGVDDAPEPIVINEVLANSSTTTLDSIELFNTSDDDVDISGWFLSDSGTNLQKFEIPSNTVLLSGEYLVFDENDFGSGANGFGLSAIGDELFLVKPDSGAGLVFVDQLDFGGAFENQSLGRIPNGSGRFAPLTTSSLGDANSPASIGSVVITEVNYHPDEPTTAAQIAFQQFAGPDEFLDDDDLEYVEIYNPTDAPINLTNWRLRGEADIDFATNLTIDPQSTIVVLPFDPDEDLARLVGFLTQYEVTGVDFYGGYSGKLNNSFGRVELQQPVLGSNGIFATADEVLYDDQAPWPVTNATGELVDGGGATLERSGPTLYGNAATSWFAAQSTPGTVDFTPVLPGDYDRNGTVDRADYDVWFANFNSTLALNADGNENGIVDAADYAVWRDNFVEDNPSPLTPGSPSTKDASTMAGSGQQVPTLAIPLRPTPSPSLSRVTHSDDSQEEQLDNRVSRAQPVGLRVNSHRNSLQSGVHRRQQQAQQERKDDATTIELAIQQLFSDFAKKPR